MGLHSIAQSSLHLYTAHSSFIAQKACIRRDMLHNRGAQDSDERNTLCIAGLFALIFIFTHLADGGFME